MSRYDDKGVWHSPLEPGRLEYKAELVTARAECKWTGGDGSASVCNRGTLGCTVKHPDIAVQSIFDKPAAVIRGCYDVVNEVPKVRAELTPDGRGLPAGTVLWPHQTPPQPKPLPKLPPVPKDMCFGSMTIGDKRVELRGWTTEMMQPWIDAVLAAFKESR